MNDRSSHLLTARIINGATVEREIPFKLQGKEKLTLSLSRPDFTTARRVGDTINAALGEGIAQIIDAGSIQLNVPESMQQEHVAEFIADVEGLSVIPDTVAKVVINEKTGTVVIGSEGDHFKCGRGPWGSERGDPGPEPRISDGIARHVHHRRTGQRPELFGRQDPGI